MSNNVIKWWRTAIIYQIYPRSFKDENNDGIGDLQGVISKLEYLKWLGVDAIWLSPFYPSPMEDFGYDVSDYLNIDPIFGTLEDMDELIEKSHNLKIRVIVDYVPNHSSADHPWFQESRASRSSSKRNWYVWKDPLKDGSPPNNWICITGGSAWTWDEKTEQYYLHSFLPCQPDLNWQNPDLCNAMLDVLRFWLDRGVDGFRIDMISWLSKDPEFRDNPLNPDFDPETDYAYLKYKQIYSKDGPELYTLFRKIRSVLDEYEGEQVIIGEVDYYSTIEYLNQYFENGIDIPVNFRLIYLPWSPSVISEFINPYEKSVSMHVNYQLGNHDQSRVASRIGQEQARIAAMLLMTLRGTLFIYYGEEIGMHDVFISPNQIQDPWERTEPGRGRDPVRTPMQWNSKANVGFSKGIPWLPVAEDSSKINVEKEKEDPKSMLTLYRELIILRKTHLSLTLGRYSLRKEVVPDECYVYQRKLDQETFVIALNLSNIKQELTLKNMRGSEIVLSSYLDRKETLERDKLFLRENEGCIILKQA